MPNHIKQAEKLVGGAVQVFEKSIQDISKANYLISQSITEDETRLAAIHAEMEKLQAEKESTLLGISLKNNKIEENAAIITKMSEFTGESRL